MAEAGGPIEILASEQAAVAAITAAALPRRFARLDRILALATEIPAAVLVSVEILVLLAGVVSRYVFNQPLTWTDELASILFLWLAMLGAVIALRRDEHMRLGVLVARAPVRWRGRLDTLAAMVVAVFVLEIILHAYNYFDAQWMITTPALEIHDGYRVAAIAVGAALMLLIAAARLIERSTLSQAAAALALVAVVALALWLLRPALMALGNFNLVVFFVGIVAFCVGIGVPIAFAFGVATLSYLALVTGAPLTIVTSRMDEGMSTLILLSVPLFVFLGLLIEMTGLARVLVDLLPALLGALALVVVCYFRSRDEDLTGVRRASPMQVARTFLIALPALALPFLIRTAVVEGVATATEVSTVGIVYAVLAGLIIYRKFEWRRLYPMLVETASLSGAILLIIGTATAMAWALTQSGFSRQLVQAMAAMPGGKLGFLAISIVAFTVLGSVLEGIPAIVLFGPLLFPAARAIGVHEVHYAMVVILSMGIGLFAPPFGVGFYAACAISRVSPDAAMGRVWPYLGALFLALIIVALVPWLSVGFL